MLPLLAGFWQDVITVLSLSLPIVKLLRLCDNQAKEVLGKIYFHMFTIGEKIKQNVGKISWAQQAADFHAYRWEYLHGRFHAAAYAFDPEFMYGFDGGDLDSATMGGTIEVVERLSLRHVIQKAADPEDAMSKLTLSSPQVQVSNLR